MILQRRQCLCLLPMDSMLVQPCNKLSGETINVANKKYSENSETTSKQRTVTPSDQHSYIPIAQHLENDQLKSKACLLPAIWFSFFVISNHWKLTTTRDFFSKLGEDAYGNWYLSIFTRMTPVSTTALPFLNISINRYRFHGALQIIAIFAIAPGLIKVRTQTFKHPSCGVCLFYIFKCFLYTVALNCVARSSLANLWSDRQWGLWMSLPV